jgi:hypothetical protein
MNITDICFLQLLNSSKRLLEKVKRANSIQHSGGEVIAEDWNELYNLQNELAGKIEIVENEMKGK